MTDTPASRWVPILLTLALLWGGAFAFVKMGLVSFTPVGIGVGRMILGAFTMLVLSAVTRTRFPPRALWGRLAVTAFLAAAVPWIVLAFAQTHISSSFAAILGSLIPLMTLLVILVYYREERPTRMRIAGLMLGLVGVLIVVGIWNGLGTSTIVGVIACFVANISFAASLPYMRRHLAGGANASTLPPIALATALLVFAAIEAAPALAFSEVTHAPVVASALIGLLAVGCLTSGIGYALNFYLVRITDATTASTVTYAVPVIAVLIGTIFLGEELSWNQPAGGLVILFGAALAQGLIRPRSPKVAGP